MKQLLEDRADFRLFISEPVLPWTTAIIILSMIYKRVNMTAMFLIAAFIFSLNPVYVVLLALFWGLLSLSSKSPKLHLPIKKKALSQVESVVCIYDFTPASISITSFHFSHIDPELFVTYFPCMCVRIRNYQGKFFIIHTCQSYLAHVSNMNMHMLLSQAATEGVAALNTSTLCSDKFDKTFDHILIGNDLSTLYAAALLARNNHRCCVLQPADGAVMKVRVALSFVS